MSCHASGRHIELYFYGELQLAERADGGASRCCAECRQALEDLSVIRAALACVRMSPRRRRRLVGIHGPLDEAVTKASREAHGCRRGPRVRCACRRSFRISRWPPCSRWLPWASSRRSRSGAGSAAAGHVAPPIAVRACLAQLGASTRRSLAASISSGRTGRARSGDPRARQAGRYWAYERELATGLLSDPALSPCRRGARHDVARRCHARSGARAAADSMSEHSEDASLEQCSG